MLQIYKTPPPKKKPFCLCLWFPAELLVSTFMFSWLLFLPLTFVYWTNKEGRGTDLSSYCNPWLACCTWICKCKDREHVDGKLAAPVSSIWVDLSQLSSASFGGDSDFSYLCFLLNSTKFPGILESKNLFPIRILNLHFIYCNCTYLFSSSVRK